MNEPELSNLRIDEDSSFVPVDDLEWIDSLDSDEVEQETDTETGNITKPWDPSLIRVDQRPYSVYQILDMIDQGDLELQPEFQRRRVWKPQQKSLLIESLLLRIPLPAFYFAADDEGHLQVIDGLQRLSTIHDFVRGKEGRKFRLSRLEYLQSVVGGKTYDDLQGQVWGRRILQSTLVANVVDPQTPSQVKLNIFTRLNKQGTPLSQQELRHAMSGKRSRDFLSELASLDEFHRATGGTLRDSKRMHDIELALRFCAFKINSYKNYSEHDSLADFLTETTKSLDKVGEISDDAMVNLKESFRTSMENAYLIFDVNCFRKRPSTPINRPLFEVWAHVLSTLNHGQLARSSKPLVLAHKQTLENRDFQDAISLNTGDPFRVRTRFETVLKALEEEGITIE